MKQKYENVRKYVPVAMIIENTDKINVQTTKRKKNC